MKKKKQQQQPTLHRRIMVKTKQVDKKLHNIILIKFTNLNLGCYSFKARLFPSHLILNFFIGLFFF